jgi:hypothetical protein
LQDEILTYPVALAGNTVFICLKASSDWLSSFPFSFVLPTVGPCFNACAMRLTLFIEFTFIYFTCFKESFIRFEFAFFAPLALNEGAVLKSFLTIALCVTFEPDSFEKASIEVIETTLAVRLTIFHLTDELLTIWVLARTLYWLTILPRAGEYDSTFKSLFALSTYYIILPFSFVHITINVFKSALAVFLIIFKIAIVNSAIFIY